MRILAVVATAGLMAFSATAPVSAGMMGPHDCFPKGCHER